MSRTPNDSTSSTCPSPTLQPADYRTIHRCLQWRCNVESALLSGQENNNFCMRSIDPQQGCISQNHMAHIRNTKVARAIESMHTIQEAQGFLDVAQDIRAERAAELAVIEQQLEQCKKELRILESKMLAARGRVVDADMGIAAMRLLMKEKGFIVDKDSYVLQPPEERLPNNPDS